MDDKLQDERFLTLFPTFENLPVVRETLPSIIRETERTGSYLIVHDCSVRGKAEKWNYLNDLNSSHEFFLILSDNLSMAMARNMLLHLGQEMYVPSIICMVEDDHGMHSGCITSMKEAIREHYQRRCPNGLRYGLFTGCDKHYWGEKHQTEQGHAYVDGSAPPGALGGVNSCCRCAPAHHWSTVLRGYDIDEYLISTFQTKHLNYRNYHRGYTSMLVENGAKMFDVVNVGRGTSSEEEVTLWDETYTASDMRSVYKMETGSRAGSDIRSRTNRGEVKRGGVIGQIIRYSWEMLNSIVGRGV